ncbi:unnamed protein product [Thlaspi arvense]|uniref:CREG-like beta-barrel domain-containing protein n=1 Tax=Thlaspi arvense TaxID=13288 RepID=A0AAU9RVQ9_THLAR|nr:unnamed protein product [Thlaspi arvense]
MEALSTSAYISNLPQAKPLLKSSLLPASSQPSCWLCNSPAAKRIPKLRIRDGSSHGLRIQALLHNETPSEGEDNIAESSGFGFFPGDIFSLSQEKLESNLNGESSHSVIDVESSLALPQGAGGNRAGLFRTPISGGVQNATSAHALPRPALAVRNLLEQARFAHLCTVMSKMHHRREGYPFGSLVDFAPDRMGHPIFLFSPLAIHTRNLLAEPRCSLVVQIPGWSGLSNARVTLFGDVYPLSEDEQEYEALQPDKIAVDGGEHNLKELNAIFSKPLRELLSTVSEVDDAALISIDSKGIDVRVRQGAQFSIQRLAFEEGHGVETLEEAKSALWKVIEKVKLNYFQK